MRISHQTLVHSSGQLFSKDRFKDTVVKTTETEHWLVVLVQMQTHTQFAMECFNNKYPALKLATDSLKATVTTPPQPCTPL